VLRDFGLVDHGEPFTRLRNQGIILAAEGKKMSKSRGTQVGPDELVADHGADALRLHLMFLGPWEQGGPWNARGITGMERFIRRAFQVVSEAAEITPNGTDVPAADIAALRRLTHRTIKRVSEDIDAFAFNTMIAALIELTNELMKLKDGPIAHTAAWRETVETLTLLMAPSTPYVAEEMWSRLGKPFSVHQQPWPTYDEALTIEDVDEVVVQVNGRVRDRLMLPKGTSKDDARVHAMASERVQEHVGGRAPARVIYVPGRLVNIVVK